MSGPRYSEDTHVPEWRRGQFLQQPTPTPEPGLVQPQHTASSRSSRSGGDRGTPYFTPHALSPLSGRESVAPPFHFAYPPLPPSGSSVYADDLSTIVAPQPRLSQGRDDF